MKTTILQGVTSTSVTTKSSSGLYDSLINYLQDKRAMVIGSTLMIQGNVIVPLLFLTLLYNPTDFQWVSISILVILSYGLLTINLALLPIRFIVNFFLFNLGVSAILAASHLLY